MFCGFVVVAVQVRWFFVGREVDDRAQKDMLQREILRSDLFTADVSIDTIERKVKKRPQESGSSVLTLSLSRQGYGVAFGIYDKCTTARTVGLGFREGARCMLRTLASK